MQATSPKTVCQVARFPDGALANISLRADIGNADSDHQKFGRANRHRALTLTSHWPELAEFYMGGLQAPSSWYKFLALPLSPGLLFHL